MVDVDVSQAKENEGSLRRYIVDTETRKIKTFQLIPQHSLMTLVQVANLSLISGVSDKMIHEFLKMEREKMKSLGEELGIDMSNILKNIPLSKATVMQILGLETNFSVKICCPECFKLYSIPEDAELESTSLKCTEPFLSKSLMFLKKNPEKEVKCDSSLFKRSNKKKKKLN